MLRYSSTCRLAILVSYTFFLNLPFFTSARLNNNRNTPDDLHRRSPKGQDVAPTDTPWRSTFLGYFPIWGFFRTSLYFEYSTINKTVRHQTQTSYATADHLVRLCATLYNHNDVIYILNLSLFFRGT